MLHFKPGAEPIPGYQLVKFLGKGQFGQVWESTAPGGGAAALKFLDLSGKQGWKEFRGIQRVKKLRHANLMPITALWLVDEDGVILDEDQVRTVIDGERDLDKTVVPQAAVHRDPRWLIVAQLLGDRTLADELERCRERGDEGLPVDSLLNYMAEAAKGIDYLNSSHRDLGDGLFAVQHCDIKPANILLLGGSALVCDFGVAQVLMDADAQARATGMTGSPAYMPPECALATPSSTSDQYSLAVSYFELRTGELPFEIKTQLAVLDAHRSGKLKLDKLPAAEQSVIRKATSVDPKKRYADCQTMVDQLRAAVRGPTPSKPRTKAILLAVLAGVLMAAAVSVIPSLLPTPTVSYKIQVEPQEASVTFNGESIEVVDGVATVKLTADQTGTIQASHGRDFESANFRLDPSQYDPQTTIQIELARSPSYLVSEALKLVETDMTSAVAGYAEVVGKDPSYARFPLPKTLMNETEGAELRPIRCNGDGHWLIGVSRDGEVYAWDITRDMATNEPEVLHTHDRVRSLAVGSSWVVSAGEDNVIVASALGNQAGAQKRSTRWPSAVYSLAISSDDRFVIIGDSEGELHKWEFARVDSEPQKIGEHQDSIDKIVIPEDSPYAFSASWDHTIGRWSLDEDNQPAADFAQAAVGIEALAATENWIAFADSNQLKISATNQGSFVSIPEAHSDAIGALIFNRTGSLLAAGSEDGKVTILRSPQEVASRGEWTEIPVPTQHIAHAVNSLAFDPVTDYLFSASNDKTIVLWDTTANLNRAVVVYRGPTSPTAVCVSKDGRWLFCESADGSVRVWDLRQITLIKKAADEAKVQPQPATPKTNVVEA